MLWNIALLNSGFLIEEPTSFTNPLQGLLKIGLGLKKDAPIEEIEVEISPEEEEEPEEEPEVEGEVEVEDDSDLADSDSEKKEEL